MNKLGFRFMIDEELTEGVARLASVLGFSLDGDIEVHAEKSERTGVTCKDGKAVIYYTKKHLFYRELGILFERAHEGDFEAFEDGFFEGLSVMLDASRCAVPRVETVCHILDRLALMGYSMVMMYTEDTIELPKRPYFGYMRGRYTHDELRAMDDYAYAYGIEMIPCLECYGHMGKYLMWREASAMRDTPEVLLAREEKTFEFLDELIGTASSCFRSKRIHVGMDEAWDMGRGRFLDRHGYVPPLTIFNEYMERLMAIINRHGLRPMMWSDMYFRASNNSNTYYGENIDVAPEIASAIPENMQLVFWHYGEKYHCDDYMLAKHVALGRSTLYAGGLWSWTGHFPESHYAMDNMRFGLDACRRNGVREAMMTLWLNDNAECDWYPNLLGLSFFAELAYDREASDKKIRARFEATSGGNYDAFLAFSDYHNKFDGGETYTNYAARFFGKPLFWQDIMEGLYDLHIAERPMSDHYAASAEKMRRAPRDVYAYLYDYAALVFDYLSLKCRIAETLVPAFEKDDRATLALIAEEQLPLLAKKTKAVHEAHREIWFSHNKIQSWHGLDIRYGGMAARCETAAMLLGRYLDGDESAAEELRQKRLDKPWNAFIRYNSISTVNGNI